MELSYGKIGTAKRVVSVCVNLSLLENKGTTNLSVADTYRFTRKYPLFGRVCHQFFLLRIIKFYAILSFLFVLIICLNNPTHLFAKRVGVRLEEQALISMEEQKFL